jgi:hypothetical protein
MTSGTRYLCVAAYLSPRFASSVIREVLATRRAVIPSHDVDLVPVIEHCLQARKIHLTRDVALTIILIAGLVVALIPTIAVIVALFLLGLPLPAVEWERKPPSWKPFTAAGVAIALAGAGVLWLAIHLQDAGGYQVSPVNVIPQLAPQVKGTIAVVVASVAFPVLAAAVLFRSSYRQARTLGERFGPEIGTAPPVTAVRATERRPRIFRGTRAKISERTFSAVGAKTRLRIAEVGAAQEGNVTLFNGQNPFIGAGNNPFTGGSGEQRAWSITIEAYAKPPKDAPADKAGPRVPADVDLVKLHDFLRRRLIAQWDARKSGGRRMPVLTIADHVAGEGLRQWSSPLIDPERKIPYSLATSEAIDVLIRTPRDGLLYYQRVSVHDAGQESWADRGVDVSAFIGVAAEGSTLFLEFIPAALPPIMGDFYIADRMPRPDSGGIRLKVIQDTARSAFRDIVAAPVLAAVTAWGIVAEWRQPSGEADPASDYVCCDVGARVSVRELAASATPRTYTQQMNAANYIQIIERQVTQAVQEFLDDNEVDTTDYRASVEKVISNFRISVGTASLTSADATGTEHPSIPAARTMWRAVAQARELGKKQQQS